MRYIVLMTAVLWGAICVSAQELPQGPSPLVIDAQESTTPTAPQLKPMEQEGPEGYSPPSIGGMDDGAVDAKISMGTSSATNSASAGPISFLMNAGVQYEDEGEYAEAEKAYLRALDAAPDNPEIRFRLSTLYIQMEQYTKAADLLKMLAEQFPENAMINNNLSWLYASGGEMKNGKLALRYAREALLSEPEFFSIWNTLAEAHYISGQYDEALRASERAIELLKSQQPKPSDEDIASFESQRTKIQRAAEVYNQMFGIEGDQ